MSKRLRCYFALPGLLIVVFAAWWMLRADGHAQEKGEKQIDFVLKDLQGNKVQLAEKKDAKAFVLVFIGTQCPINNLYMPRLNQLAKEFAAKGVPLLAINSNVQDSTEQIAEHARKMEITFPVLRDEDNRVADLLGAKRTPEAFVLDKDCRIRYRGRIDDRFGIDYQRPKPTREDLVIALEEVLAGKEVTVAQTEVPGCIIGRRVAAVEKAPITFTKHILPILQRHCQECHREGQIGPMPLYSYEDVTGWSQMIKEVLEDQRMPPWYADPKHGNFSNDRRLPAKDKETLLAWIDGGMAKGDPKDTPPPRKFAEGWIIGEPDAVFHLPQEVEVPAKMPPGGVPYMYFSVDTNFTEDKWVERAEARAGQPSVVHHIIVFVVPPGERFFQGNPKSPVLAGTAPGDMPLILQPGMAAKIPKGSRLVFQMHYTPNGKAVKDRSSVGLIFAKEPPKKYVRTHPIAVPPIGLRIPAGSANHKVESRRRINTDAWVVGMMPHMHLRGKDFVYYADLPDGTTKTLLSVPRFNFYWQSVYRPTEPIFLPKGTTIRCIAHFDNSADNPNNPDPTQMVTWGDQTWEEMMIGWIDLAYEREKE